MAEKKATKKFGQKRDFKSEKKKIKDNTYMKKKTYKETAKKQKKITDEKSEPKKVTSKKNEKSLCPVHGKCGGCQLLDMPYEKQLKKKQNHVSKLVQPYLQDREDHWNGGSVPLQKQSTCCIRPSKGRYRDFGNIPAGNAFYCTR